MTETDWLIPGWLGREERAVVVAGEVDVSMIPVPLALAVAFWNDAWLATLATVAVTADAAADWIAGPQ